MSELIHIIERLDNKINTLIQSNREVIEEKQKIQAERDALVIQVNAQTEMIGQLEGKATVESVSQTLAGEAKENKEVKAKIHELVKDIDKCISLLNR
ncbi:MAG: hypothetical protein KKA07_10895 [Bacteroidetes bacterium]|nr:hypothetical protein [Bacteroidota bacterium]MBU1719565.1 hypothetical protein [Bacteroidota bacterium]